MARCHYFQKDLNHAPLLRPVALLFIGCLQ